MIDNQQSGVKGRTPMPRYAGSHPADPLRGLRTLFEPIVEEPLPGAFYALLERIGTASRQAAHAPRRRTAD